MKISTITIIVDKIAQMKNIAPTTFCFLSRALEPARKPLKRNQIQHMSSFN